MAGAEGSIGTPPLVLAPAARNLVPYEASLARPALVGALFEEQNRWLASVRILKLPNGFSFA